MRTSASVNPRPASTPAGPPAASRRLTPRDRRIDMLAAAGLLAVMFVVYNANGREIGSYDTQPTKLAARELLLRRTLALGHVVGATPEFAERWGFIQAADGNYRSIYSPVPAVLAAAIAWPFWKAGLLDLRAPLGAAALAVLAASLLTAAAVVLAFFSARQRLTRGPALLLAAGLGLATGFWSTASQTLWQTDAAVFAIALAVLVFATPSARLGAGAFAPIGLGLGLALATRPQLAPLVGVLLLGTWRRRSLGGAAAATAIVGVLGAALAIQNMRWFGHPLGALPLLQDRNALVHASGASFRLSLEGFVGLLVSPSRGLLIFSPVVLVAAAGVRQALSETWDGPLRWCAMAIVAQYLLYGSYSVWWGGHTYGPRYLLDLLPVAVPLAAAAMARPSWPPVATAAAATALAWSLVISGTGAFYYPNDQWNSNPTDIDRDHARLWDWSDNQIRRCWKAGPSPQNFALFDRNALRVRPQ